MCWQSWRAEAFAVHVPVTHSLVHSSSPSLALLSAVPMMHKVWLFYKSNSSSMQKVEQTSQLISEILDQMVVKVNAELYTTPRGPATGMKKLWATSCFNISSKCVRNRSQLEARCVCQLSCQQPGLVLESIHALCYCPEPTQTHWINSGSILKTGQETLPLLFNNVK